VSGLKPKRWANPSLDDMFERALKEARHAGKLPDGFISRSGAEAAHAAYKKEMSQIFGYAPPDPPSRNVRQQQIRRQHRWRSPRRKVIG
jgi:hypothetical protein